MIQILPGGSCDGVVIVVVVVVVVVDGSTDDVTLPTYICTITYVVHEHM